MDSGSLASIQSVNAVGQTKVELENKTFFVSFSRVCNSWAHLGFLCTQSITYLAIKNEDTQKKIQNQQQQKQQQQQQQTTTTTNKNNNKQKQKQNKK